MNSLDTTWLFFVCILDLKGLWWLIYSLHYISSQYTTWDFEAYAVKSIGWLVFNSHYMSSQYTTWLFWTYILESNASDGRPTYTTWTPLTLHDFFSCVYWIWKGLDGWSIAYTTWVPYTLHEFLKHMLSKASAGWSLPPTTWVPNTLHGFFERIYRKRTPLMADELTLHELPWHYMAFFRVYTGSERALMADL